MTEVAEISKAATLNKLIKNISLPILQVITFFVEKENFVLFDSVATPIPGHRVARDVIVQHFIWRRVIG